MKHILIILSVLLCGYTLAYPCRGSSCCCSGGGSSCCNGVGSSCCSGGGSSCCSGGGSSCCNEGGSSCCNRGGSSCCSDGGTSCCAGSESSRCCKAGSSCCGGDGSPCGPAEKCSDRTEPPPPPIIIPPSDHPSPQPGTRHNTSIANNNNITIPTDITIENEVRSETRVNVPVSIIVNNQNDIQIKSDSVHESSKCYDEDCKKKEQSCTNNTKVVTVTVPVPVPVTAPTPYPVPVTIPTSYPVPIPIPRPYIVTVPMQQSAPMGCCTMVTPCMPYTHSGCVHNSLQCGGQCSGSVMYQPTSLCQSGCLQVPSSYGVQCGMRGCNRTPVDCSMCNGNWGQTYDTFKMCSGCFLPMGWGGGLGGDYYGK